MQRHWVPSLLVAILVAASLMAPVSGQDKGLFGHKREAGPPTLAQVARMIDQIEETILDKGTVVIKQPDIWSQGRMTMFRKEFENTMRARLDDFKPLLSARIARSDSANFASQTALGAALSPAAKGFDPGLSSVSELSAERKEAMALIVNNAAQPKIDMTTGVADFALLNAVTAKGSASGKAVMNLDFGLEPNVQLDQEADYITHLHRLRRVNLGDDNTDSAGYEMYLMRVPVSIQPGDRTVRGHGAVVTVTMRHDFAPRFLYQTYRNLVINDLIDKLAPPVHELIRSGNGYSFRREIDATNARLMEVNSKIESLRHEAANLPAVEFQELRLRVDRLQRIALLPTRRAELRDAVLALKSGMTNLTADVRGISELIKQGSAQLEDERTAIAADFKALQERVELAESMKRGPLLRPFVDETKLAREVDARTEAMDAIKSAIDEGSLTPEVLKGAARTLESAGPGVYQALADQAKRLASNYTRREQTARALVQIEEARRAVEAASSEALLTLSAAGSLVDVLSTSVQAVASASPSSRSGARINAIAPSDVPRVFIEDNLLYLAQQAQMSLDLQYSGPPENKQRKVRMTDVRTYLRHELEAAYDIMKGQDRSRVSVLQDVGYIEGLLNLVTSRAFDDHDDDDLPVALGAGRVLEGAYRDFATRLPGNVRKTPLGPLCWAIAIEAGMLDRFLKDDMLQTKGQNDYSAPADIESLFFYQPDADPRAELAFQEYVKARWPMITFALEPVVDQQNIEDAFTRRRDLQLAIAFALSSGRISFRQAMQYTRQLQYEAQTIALNQTVSAFAHGNDTFGWRFTPRYQTPPEESNPRAVTNLLLRGGPGPNYQIKQSKIEPGLRELTAVVVMPSFVRSMRLDVSSDWFQLHDPDHRKINTAQTVELGRKINEARQCLEAACQCGLYRPEDTERLRARLHQLEAMLPMQTAFVKVPYENTVGGFSLFTQGASALVPELSGYEGVEYLDRSKPQDIIVYGKHFSIYESAVVAGGVALPREGAESYTVQETGGTSKVVGGTLTPLRDANGKLLLFKADGTPIPLTDNGSYDILSREVMRVRIPANVAVATRDDGQEVVELYVSTPNGISNRLQVPVKPSGGGAGVHGVPTGAGLAFLEGGITAQVEAYIDSSATPSKLVLVKPRALPRETVMRLQPIATEAATAGAMNVQLNYTIATSPTASTLSIDVEDVRRDRDGGPNSVYTLRADQLDRVVKRIYETITEAKLALPAQISARSVLVTAASEGGSGVASRTYSVTNSFQITFETVLVPKSSGTALGPAERDDAGLTRTAFELPPLPGDSVHGVGRVSAAAGDGSVRALSHGSDGRLRAASYQDWDDGAELGAGLVGVGASVLGADGLATANRGGGENPISNGAAQARLAPAQSVVVVPTATPRVNVNVPITNTPPRKALHGLFRRGAREDQVAPRRSIFERVMNGP